MFEKRSRSSELKSNLDTNLKSILENKSTDVETISGSSTMGDYLPTSMPIAGRIANLIQEVLQLEDVTIYPVLDYSADQIIYPILSTIDEAPNNTVFLDDLVTGDIFDKGIHERLIVCPLHPKSISATMRIYCPKCNSANIEKLNLVEHKKCGHIIESKISNYSTSTPFVCPSCSKEINNAENDIKVLAMWYRCENCAEKFDDALIKLHCRKFNHDFDANSGKFNTLFYYRLKTLHISKDADTTNIKNELVKLLHRFKITTKQNTLVKGKSGNMHDIAIYATGTSDDDTLLFFVKNRYEGISESDMNSILIAKLDFEPKHALFVTQSPLQDGVENLAKLYGIVTISEPEFIKIRSRVEEFVSSWYADVGGHK